MLIMINILRNSSHQKIVVLEREREIQIHFKIRNIMKRFSDCVLQLRTIFMDITTPGVLQYNLKNATTFKLIEYFS